MHGHLNLPFDWPLSMRELARRPRKLELLLRDPEECRTCAARISLFRLMTGVSAKGNDMTLVAFCLFPTANCSGDLCGLPSRGACSDFPSRLGFLVFEAAGGSGAGALSPDSRADRLLLGAGSSAGGSRAGVFLRRVSLAAAASGGSEDWLAPLLLDVLALENMKPSLSSSYTGHGQHS
jgi:hypothetical protein